MRNKVTLDDINQIHNLEKRGYTNAHIGKIVGLSQASTGYYVRFTREAIKNNKGRILEQLVSIKACIDWCEEKGIPYEIVMHNRQCSTTKEQNIRNAEQQSIFDGKIYERNESEDTTEKEIIKKLIAGAISSMEAAYKLLEKKGG